VGLNIIVNLMESVLCAMRISTDLSDEQETSSKGTGKSVVAFQPSGSLSARVVHLSEGSGMVACEYASVTQNLGLLLRLD
jgi:hypothetical protein